MFVALLVWFVPTVAYLAQPPHEYSTARFRDVFPKPTRLEILRPAPESLAAEAIIEWQLSYELSRTAQSSRVGLEVWLDRELQLAETMSLARASRDADGALEPFRLTYDFASLRRSGNGHVFDDSRGVLVPTL